MFIPSSSFITFTPVFDKFLKRGCACQTLKSLFGSMLNVFLSSLHLNFSFNYIHYMKRRDCDCRFFALDAYILKQALLRNLFHVNVQRFM